MVLFLLFSAPLTVIAAGMLLDERIDHSGIAYSDRTYLLVRHAVLPGIFLFVLMYIFFLAIRWIMPYRYTVEGLYFFHLVVDYFYWAVAATAGSVFVARRIGECTGRDRFLVDLLFYGMIFGLLSATDTVMHDGYWTVYQTILLPLGRSGMIVLLPVVLALTREKGWSLSSKWHWIVPVLYAAGWGAVAMWSEWLRPRYAALTATGLTVLTAIFFYFVLFHNRPSESDVTVAAD